MGVGACGCVCVGVWRGKRKDGMEEVQKGKRVAKREYPFAHHFFWIRD